ncbi:hypothetical protein [Streptomyces anulatus]|uniref:hypothetical protein n=1 Tax=Streptomyces anulatus TaxID=1892 RepID=UPI001C2581C6|nr:hypothetical protein [Streptomyces anulatus]
MPVLHLTHEVAERVVVFDITGAPDVPPCYLTDDPAAVPPMRPTQVHATYRSRAGTPWTLETVLIRGLYVPADPASRWAGCRASGIWLYPSSPSCQDTPQPRWAADLASALAVPAPVVAAGPVNASVTSDLAKRMRYFTLDGPDEITHWLMPAPLRPDKLRATYLSNGDAAWNWDEFRFQGPYVATGEAPEPPNRNFGRQSYTRASLCDAPGWVLDVIHAHRSPAPLPAGQRP